MASNTYVSIRLAESPDFVQIREWDEFWGDRRQEMQRGEIYVAEGAHNDCLGYMRIARNEFLNYPFIAILCVKQDCRRTGVGLLLLDYLGSVLNGLRVFTTTEETNPGMVALLKKVNFQEAGYVDMLNSDGSRELIFTKQL